MTPLDLVRAAPWDTSFFTTYALSLSFFEAVILDRLMRGGSKQATILTDPEGLRAALSEHGARRAGRDYEIEPVACTTGVFHPKVSAFINGADAHLLVGSGNLTFGGWGGNLEAIDHLHPSFAADAFDDAADFFELMTLADTLVFDAGDACIAMAGSLRRAAAGAPRSGRIRILHSVGGAIATQLRGFADEFGGAERITAVSPFYDLGGSGIDALARDLRCEKVQLHVHPDGVVRGQGSIAWPFDSKTPFTPVTLESDFPGDKRLLHAKCFEIRCKRGTILMSGSANATSAGLYGRNVEASVVRLLPRSKAYWAPLPAEAPLRISLETDDEENETETRIGILRAVLDGDQIKGRAITPQLVGDAIASLDVGGARRDLGQILIRQDGRFEMPAPGLEAASFEHGRLIMRLEQRHHSAEGIVSIAAAAELIRRIGPMAPRIMAMLAGSETPADVAAILSWFRDDPSRLPTDTVVSGGGDGSGSDEAGPSFITLDELTAAAGQDHTHFGAGGAGQPAWRNAMALLRAAFRQPRGRWAGGAETDDDDDDDPAAKEQRARDEERSNRRTMRAFDDLLPIMLAPEREGRDAPMALALAHFLTDRILPAPAKVHLWLGNILPQIADFTGADGNLAISTVLIHYGADGRPDAAGRARRYFLQRNLAPEAIHYDPTSAPAFADLLAKDISLEAFAISVGVSRTPAEQVRAYVAAARGEGPRTGYPLLERSPHWARLARGLDDPAAFAKFKLGEVPAKACPKCRIQLSVAAYEDLRETGVTWCCAILMHGAC
jgi:hypothetical protein